MKLTLLMTCAAFMAATPAFAGITDTGKRLAETPDFIPSVFAADGKAVMYVGNEGNNGAMDEYVILDNQFNEVRKITFSYEEVTATKTVWRKLEGPIGITEANRMITNEMDNIPLEQFIQMGNSQGFIRREDHGNEVWLMSIDQYAYYAYEAYEYKYPQEMMIWSANHASWYRIEYNNEGYGIIPGKYGEPETREESYTPSVVNMERKTAECVDYDGLYLSQTLFNNDAQIEWLIPVYTVSDCSYEDNYEKVEGKEIHLTGYKVISENGSQVASFNLPAGYTSRYDDIYLYEAGGKNYLVASCYTTPNGSAEEEAYVVYETDPASSSVRQITEARKVRVSPTAPRRGTCVNVELGEPAGANSKVVVTSVNGRTVLDRNIAAGTTATSIDTDNFAAGVYVVTVSDGKSSREASKIIVR